MYLFALSIALSIEPEGYCSSAGLFVADIVHNHGNLGIAFARAIWIGTCRDFEGTGLDSLTILEVTRLHVEYLVIFDPIRAGKCLGKVVVVLHQHWEIFPHHGGPYGHVEIHPSGLGADLSFIICQIITRVFVLVCLRCNTPG